MWERFISALTHLHFYEWCLIVALILLMVIINIDQVMLYKLSKRVEKLKAKECVKSSD